MNNLSLQAEIQRLQALNYCTKLLKQQIHHLEGEMFTADMRKSSCI